MTTKVKTPVNVEELQILWNYLNKKELINYYGVTDRTLYNYRKKYNLPDKCGMGVDVQDTRRTYTVKDYVVIFVNDTKDNTNKLVFKNWNHFSLWVKAQRHPITFTNMEKQGVSHIVCHIDRSRII